MKKRLALAACLASLATGNAFADSKLLVSSLLIDWQGAAGARPESHHGLRGDHRAALSEKVNWAVPPRTPLSETLTRRIA